MSNSLIKDITNFLKNSFNTGESIPVHDLLFWVDAKHKIIPNPDELNSAIKLIGGCQISSNENGVFISKNEQEISDLITQADLKTVFNIYKDKFNNLR